MSYFGLSAVLVFALDQMTKSMIQHGLENRSLQLGRIVTLRFLASAKRYYRAPTIRAVMTVLWFLAAVSALLLSIATPTNTVWIAIAMGAAVGGAAGNLLDVLRHRAVRDFIDLGWWPVFNLADVAIVAGIAGMLIGR